MEDTGPLGMLAESGGGAAAGRAAPALPAPPRPARRRRLTIQLAILAGYLALGAVEMLPGGTILTGHLQADSNSTQYVWDLWWVARQVSHLHNPWMTSYLAAPVGMPLGFDTLMPLPGVLLMPVTLLFGPAISFTLLTIALPGLMCYAMYRAARLWLKTQAGAIAAGALFGLSTMVMFQDEYHLNIAAGQLLLPMTLEAAVLLRRRPGVRQALVLGAVVGATFLVNQESAIMTVILAVVTLLPWLARRPLAGKLRPAALAAATGALVASPQLIVMAAQAKVSATSVPAHTVASWDARFGVPLLTLFSPSPRLASYGVGALTQFAQVYKWGPVDEGRPTYGLILTVLAVAGIVIGWRHATTWRLALLWAGTSALTLGTVLVIGRRYVPLAARWHGIEVSLIMPYTWFIRLPGMSAFREADRLALLGLVPAVLLAGVAVDWLAANARPLLIVVAAAGLLEAGWASTAGLPATMPAVDGPIAADHSNSIVVDVPFGIQGGIPSFGGYVYQQALALAAEDGHPRAISYTSWVAQSSWDHIRRHAFYQALLALQDHQPVTAAQAAAARADARRMDVGWVLAWQRPPGLATFLREAGFRFGYRADSVSVYRAA